MRLPLKLGIKSGQKQVPGKKINSPRWGKENSISERRPIQYTAHRTLVNISTRFFSSLFRGCKLFKSVKIIVVSVKNQ